MLKSAELVDLAARLSATIDGFGLATTPWGRSDDVKKAANEAERLFQNVAKAQFGEADSYAAALTLLRGQRLTHHQLDLVAGALSMPIKEQGGACILGSPKLAPLLDAYERSAKEDSLWRLTWFALLCSYFSFDPSKASGTAASGWTALQGLLQRTWPYIDGQSSGLAVPDWVKVLRSDPALLTDAAAERYGDEFMRGASSGIHQLQAGLAVPESSWFWHRLTLAAVRACCGQADEAFKQQIPRLLELIRKRPVYRDDALEIILNRYHRCQEKPVHRELRDYVCNKGVWRNPKLRSAGLATSWARVSDDVWRMVLQWVNEANLKDFFEILAARGNPDEARLAFWGQYLEQIEWTRLIFSSDTLRLAYRNEAVRNLIAREEGAYATMSDNNDVDAFMMQIGSYIIVEFSKQPNAAYIYPADGLPFKPYSTTYYGSKADLKAGYGGNPDRRITHPPGWELGAKYKLKAIGIRPDAMTTSRGRSTTSLLSVGQPPAPVQHTESLSIPVFAPTTASRSSGSRKAPKGAPFTYEELELLVSKYPGALINDLRAEDSSSSGRLWVEDRYQDANLGRRLMAWKFRWASKRIAFYYPDS